MSLGLALAVSACAPGAPAPAASATPGLPGQLATPPRLWGSLSAGPHAVGFGTLYRVDRTRTWRATRGADRPFAPDPGGRPIRISLWYPAVREGRSRRLRFADYVHPDGPAELAELNGILALREQIYAADRAPAGRWQELLATPVASWAEATPAPGRYPLVLFAGALGDTSTTSASVAAEYLASHGYVVATVPVLGPASDDTEQGRTAADRERTVRDLEVAWSIVRELTDVDSLRIGVFGHSIGGIEALVFAMRNANVSAVAGLDGTYGFRGLGTLLAELPGFSPHGLRAAFLDVRRPDGDYGGFHDLAIEHGFRHADRTFVTLGGLRHRDFRTYAMASFALTGAPDGEAAYRGYQTVCRVLLDFFDDKLKGDHSGARRLAADVASAERGAVVHEDAIAPPPSPDELVALVAARGFDAAIALIDQLRRDVPDEPVVDDDRCSDRSAQLLASGKPAGAIALRRLLVHVHPGSATAAESLADAYLAAGDPGAARAALVRAIERVPDDPALDDAQKQALATQLRDKLARLPP